MTDVKDPRKTRRSALCKRVRALLHRKTRSQAVHSVKKRLNVLRIYRKKSHMEDMRYLDKKYKSGGTTRAIC